MSLINTVECWKCRKQLSGVYFKYSISGEVRDVACRKCYLKMNHSRDEENEIWWETHEALVIQKDSPSICDWICPLF